MKLHCQLQEKGICAIAGMGGIGKTELALQYALKNKDQYPGGVCWLDVREVGFANKIVSYFVNKIVPSEQMRLDLPIPNSVDLPEKVKVEYCWDHWQEWQEGNVLIIFDDVPDYGEVKPYLPPLQSQFKVLMTSRLKPDIKICPINLDVLKEKQALELLKLVIGRDIDSQLDQAKALCQWVEYLPLGLELVGRYLNKDRSIPLAEVLECLEEKKLKTRVLKFDKKLDPFITAKLGVADAFELSWEDISEDAQKLGCRLSLFAPVPIDWSWIDKCAIKTKDKNKQKEARKNLISYHLLQETEDNRYRLHPLIREFFQMKLEKMDGADEYKRDFCEVMLEETEKFFQSFNRGLAKQEKDAVSPIISHLAEVCTLSNHLNDKDFCLPFIHRGRFYRGQGNYNQEEKVYMEYKEAFKNRKPTYKIDKNLEIASILNALASVYRCQRRYSKAVKDFKNALKFAQNFLGEEHQDVATIKSNLALTYCEMGQPEEAKPLFQEVLKIRQRHLGTNHADVANSLENLAYCYSLLPDLEEAEKLLRQALEIKNHYLKRKNLDVADTLHALAYIYHKQGRYEAAEVLVRGEVLPLRKELLVLQDSHPDIGRTRYLLGVLCGEQGRLGEARDHFQKALDIFEKCLNPEHLDIADTKKNLELLKGANAAFSRSQ